MVVDVRPLQDSLDRRGYRLTTPRLKLLDAIMAVPGLFTAEEVHVTAPSVGRATVYRTIRLLVELGVVCKMVLEDGAPRYRLASPAHHHHLICVRCGGSQDFARCEVDEVIERLQQTTGYRALGHRMEVYGVCGACQQLDPGLAEG